MSDLSDAIELVGADQSDNGAIGLFEARTLVVDAARRWSDLMKAAEDDINLSELLRYVDTHLVTKTPHDVC